MVGSKGQNSTFSDHGHVAYQIKGNLECHNMVATFCPPFHPLPNPVCEVQTQVFQNMVMLHIKLNEIKMQQYGRKYFPRRPPPLPSGPWRWGQKVKIQFFKNMVIVHIKLKGITSAATWWQIFCPQTPPPPHDPRGQKVRFNFFRIWSCCISN